MSSIGRTLIGTSGWSYGEWRGRFYPTALPAADLLPHYSARLPAVETNSSFYGVPSAETVARWRTALPAGFVMAVKAPQAITHRQRLRGCRAALTAFITRMRGLGPALGPVLFQLPPNLAPDAGLLRDFLADARAAGEAVPGFACPPLVVEFRHPGWYADAITAVLTGAGAARCVHDMPDSANGDPGDGPLLYVRRHGTTGLYTGAYDDWALERDARLVAAWTARGRDACVFFNNTAGGDAPVDALRLRRLLAGAGYQDGMRLAMGDAPLVADRTAPTADPAHHAGG